VFSGLTEVTCNLFTLYSYEVVFGYNSETARSGWTAASRKTDRDAYLTSWPTTADFSAWQGSPFLALDTFVLLQEGFGWDAFKQLKQIYLDMTDEPSGDSEEIDRYMLEMSQVANHNLYPYFAAWAWPISQNAINTVGALNLTVWTDDPLLSYHGAPLVTVSDVDLTVAITGQTVEGTLSFTRPVSSETGNGVSSIVDAYVVFEGNATNYRAVEVGRFNISGEPSRMTVALSFTLSDVNHNKLTVVATSAHSLAWTGYESQVDLVASDDGGEGSGSSSDTMMIVGAVLGSVGGACVIAASVVLVKKFGGAKASGPKAILT